MIKKWIKEISLRGNSCVVKKDVVEKRMLSQCFIFVTGFHGEGLRLQVNSLAWVKESKNNIREEDNCCRMVMRFFEGCLLLGKQPCVNLARFRCFCWTYQQFICFVLKSFILTTTNHVSGSLKQCFLVRITSREIYVQLF